MINLLSIYDELSPLYSSTKKEISELAKRQSEFIIESGSSEKAFAFMKKIKDLAEKVIDGIKDDAISEISKGNNFAHGVKLSIGGKVTYDYSKDKVWLDLKDKLEQRQTFLKSINYFIDEVDEDTGEVTRIFQAGKKVSDFIESKY